MSESVLRVPPLWRKQDWAYSNVRDWILDAELTPGQSLDQDAIAARLNISRLPLRQALARLFSEGLVEHEPHQRWVVAPISLDNARDVYAGREALEVALTRRAAALADEQDYSRFEGILQAQAKALEDGDLRASRTHDRLFHEAIYGAANMPRTLGAHQQLRAISDRYIAMYMSDIERSRASLTEHYVIIEALRQREIERACELVAAHVRRGIELLEETLTRT